MEYNATIRKFGHPGSLVHEYRHWLVLVRPAQVTIGSLILATRSDATAYGELPVEAFAEQAEAVTAIERALAGFCRFERLNYLMLMMVDPHVHFHVIPRYSAPREWRGRNFPDAGWPGPPDLGSVTKFSDEEVHTLAQELKPHF